MQNKEEKSMDSSQIDYLQCGSNELKTIKDQALHYLLKHKLIPIPCMGEGENKGKIPLVKWKEIQELPSIQQVKDWFNRYPTANIGFKTGAASGILVLDNDGVEITESIPITPIGTSRDGHFHYYFQNPELNVPPSASKIGEHLDIRCDQAFIVAPPSKHFDKTTGQQDSEYQWCEGLSPCDVAFAPCPEWLINKLKETAKKSPIKLPDMVNIGEGSRDNTMLRLADSLLAKGTKPKEAWLVMNEVNRTYTPPLNKDAMQRIFKQAQNFINTETPIQKSTSEETRTPIDFLTMEQIIHKWLLINDKGLIRVLIASVIANKLQADPVWLFIIAAPGGSKTELIRGLSKVDLIYSISDLTPQTFLSGEKEKKSASLLLRLPFGTIFTYKDFTTVLTMHRDKQQAIISQLREIFDGYYRKEFGTGETKDWEGKIGFIAGVTTVIDRHHEIYSVLGERFVQYRPIQPDRIAMAKKAISNSGGENLMREEIQNAMADYISGIKIPEEKVPVPDWLVDKVAHLASFVVKARSGIIREGYHTREIEQIPDPELPTRLAKQLITIATAFSLMSEGKFTEEDYSLIYKIGLDSLPAKRKLTIEVLIKQEDYLDTTEVAIAIGYPTNTTRRILEDLQGLQLIDKQPKWKGKSDGWKIKNSTIDDLKKAGWVPEESDFIKEVRDTFNTTPEMSEGSTTEPKQEELSLT